MLQSRIFHSRNLNLKETLKGNILLVHVIIQLHTKFQKCSQIHKFDFLRSCHMVLWTHLTTSQL